jgi:PEP-CTERM motif
MMGMMGLSRLLVSCTIAAITYDPSWAVKTGGFMSVLPRFVRSIANCSVRHSAPVLLKVLLACSLAFSFLSVREARADSIIVADPTITFKPSDTVIGGKSIDLENTNPVAVTLTDFLNAKGKFIFKNTFQDQTIKDLKFSFSVAQTFNISAGFMNSNVFDVFDTTTCPGNCNTTMVTVSATGTATGLSPQQTVGVVFANATYTAGANDVLFTVTPSLSSVPEPTSLVLFSIGLAGLALCQCKRLSLNRTRS